ncbi:hypothetical protein RS86_00761 [Microbacterium azadirachtae]|uniref:Uncharacterized protein n=1 Tax=Microbacterium azadirachtae TaxID=582680 RepID=A0A0F0LSK6_9MICO|nr:hypothetical protein RS86_00761 [Microbacterium azadirachtae]
MPEEGERCVRVGDRELRRVEGHDLDRGGVIGWIRTCARIGGDRHARTRIGGGQRGRDHAAVRRDASQHDRSGPHDPLQLRAPLAERGQVERRMRGEVPRLGHEVVERVVGRLVREGPGREVVAPRRAPIRGRQPAGHEHPARRGVGEAADVGERIREHRGSPRRIRRGEDVLRIDHDEPGRSSRRERRRSLRGSRRERRPRHACSWRRILPARANQVTTKPSTSAKKTPRLA